MLSHRHNWISTIFLLTLAGIAFGAGTDDAPNVTYHATTSEVRVKFFATDDRSNPLGAVSKDDFVIVDGDMVVREFRSLTRVDETTLDVVVMIDASESMTARLPTAMNYVLRLLSQKRFASDGNISVVSFSGLQPVTLCAGDCGSPASARRLLSVKASGATPLFDATAYAANLLSNHQTSGVRPVLILLSDGDDTISKTSAEDALQALIASGALLYAVDLNNAGNATQGSATLRRMAEATGGRYFSAQKGAADVLQAVLEDLQSSYVVTYQLPNRAPGYHSLRILPKHNLNLRFHCRSGYYYDKNIP